jgi:DNA-binding beta-propeller fold protein YncE
MKARPQHTRELGIVSSIVILTACINGSAFAQEPYRVVAQWKIGGQSRWDYLHIDPASQHLYVSHGDAVEVLDAKTGQWIGAIRDLRGPHGIAIDGEGRFGYISDSAGGVVVFDTQTLAKVKSIPTQFSADGIIYEPKTKTIWTFTGRDGAANATAIDTTTQTVAATIPLAKGRLEAETTDGEGHVFGNIGRDIARIDAAAKTIDAQWTTGCNGGSGLAFDTEHNRIFQACRGRKMYVVDAGDGRVLGWAEIGDLPDGAGYNAKSRLAFVSTGDGFLSIIDGASAPYPAIQKLATADGARTMTYDPTTDRLYTASAEPDPKASPPPPMSPGGPPPGAPSPYKPDTFGVIVIGR